MPSKNALKITVTVTDKFTPFLIMYYLMLTQLRLDRFKAIEDNSK